MKQKIVFAIFMGAITTCLVSFTLVLVNQGLAPGFVLIWMRSWLIAYIIATPVVLLLSPNIQLLANHLCKKQK